MTRSGITLAATLLGLLAGAQALAETPAFGAPTLCLRDPTRAHCSTPNATPSDGKPASVGSTQTASYPYGSRCWADRTRPGCDTSSTQSVVTSQPTGGGSLLGALDGAARGALGGVPFCIAIGPATWFPPIFGACAAISATLFAVAGGVSGASKGAAAQNKSPPAPVADSGWPDEF